MGTDLSVAVLALTIAAVLRPWRALDPGAGRPWPWPWPRPAAWPALAGGVCTRHSLPGVAAR